MPVPEAWICATVIEGVRATRPAATLRALTPTRPPPGADLARVEFVATPHRAGWIPELLGVLPALQVVQTLTAGVEWLSGHLPPGVSLCNAAGIRDTAVAEWVLMAILAAEKEFAALAADHAAQRWRPRLLTEVAGRRVLLVGYGRLGQAVEHRLRALEVIVERVARRARPGVAGVEDLPRRLAWADIVVLLLPETPQTIRLFDRRMLARMPDGALLVNAGRGTVVDSVALRRELQAGRLRAVIDVTDPEPLPARHPLWRAPGLLITPHLAGDTVASQRRLAAFVAAQLVRHLEARTLANVVATAPPARAD